MRIEIISVMTFDDDGKIASMKAYWGPDNITAASLARSRSEIAQKTANHIAM